MSGWINVNDQLPPPNQKVICIGGNGGIFPATKLGPNRLLMRNDKWRIRADHQSKWRTFIWWMPIPELPERMERE